VIQTFHDERGNLTVIEKLPFQIKRVYFLHGVPGCAKRGGHAHKKVHRLIVPASGSFRARMGTEDVLLNDPSVGLFVPPLTWLELSEFSYRAVCLVLASEEHEESDCIRSIEEFNEFIGAT
jgi:hypothetical protein